MAEVYEKEMAERLVEKEELKSQIGTKSYSDDNFGTAINLVLTTLNNPLKLWKSDDYQTRRTIVYMMFDGKLGYRYGQGFGTINLEPSIAAIQSLGAQKSDLVEVAGIEPASEISLLKYLQACSVLMARTTVD